MTDTPKDWWRREGLALLTDFYELTMMAGYWKDGRADQRVSFNYFFRSLPPHAGFGVMAGLEPFLDYLDHLRFEKDDLDYLRSLKTFDEGFLDWLKAFRPRVTVRAMREGTLIYPYEPIAQVEGPLLDAQLVESALLNIMNYQTLIATKAARVCLAANYEPVMEFGLRRAHGPDGGVSGSRAAYIGGCSASSNVLAGKVYGIPVSGTHAHSWVMSFDSELEAFRSFANYYPDRPVLLVDTYDTVESGVPNAITVFKEMIAEGKQVRPAIRLDSGDLAKLSKIAYKMMTEAGLENPLIVGSNDLEEDLIADLKRQGAKINAWGVGTQLITAYDKPSWNGVYKLVAVQDGDRWKPRMKISSNLEKATDPGRKHLVRYFAASGAPLGDMMALEEEEIPREGTVRGRYRTWTHRGASIREAARSEEMLKTVFDDGDRIAVPVPVAEIRQYAIEQIDRLPEEFKRLRNPEIYQVLLSPELGELKDRLLNASG
jgi:nicotinate phosphoribosyltransferase